jgi:hypothetical protein
MTTGRIAEPLHFKKTDLIQTTSKDVDNVAIVGGPLGEIFIKL